MIGTVPKNVYPLYYIIHIFSDKSEVSKSDVYLFIFGKALAPL